MFTFLSAFTEKNNNQRLWEIFGQYKEFMMHTYPEWATYEGDHRYDDRLTDYSEKAIFKNYESLQKFHSDLSKIEINTLSDENKINFALFNNELAEFIDSKEFNLHYLPITQLDGIHIDLPQIVDVQPLNTQEDLKKYFFRLKKAPKQIDNIIANMKEGIKNKITHPKYICQEILKQIDEINNLDSEKLPFFVSIKDNHFIEKESAKQLESELKQILELEIKVAYEKLYNFLKDEYLPYSRTEAGYWSLENGDRIYQHLIKFHTSLNLSPEEIHQIGLNEVKRIKDEMEIVKEQTGFKGTLQEFNHFLRTDSQFYYTKKEDLLNSYRQILSEMDKKLPELFGHLPKATYEIKEIEEYRAKSAPQAFYYSAPDDGSRPGYYYANTFDLSARPKFTMTALSLHEAVPGHHLQIALAQELESFPWFRKHLEMTAFIEGWALYAESLGYETGMYDDKYQHYGALTYEMERACRLVIDTGLHHKKWTREQAIEYLKINTPSAEIDIIAEIERYIVWPGQALAYKLGEMKITELRKLAQNELGDRFDVREFHDNVLVHGAIPLSMLEKFIKEWIRYKKNN